MHAIRATRCRTDSLDVLLLSGCIALHYDQHCDQQEPRCTRDARKQQTSGASGDGKEGVQRAQAGGRPARRAQRWAEAVGADAATLDGLPEARREFLDEFERDLPKNDPAPRTAPAEDASTAKSTSTGSGASSSTRCATPHRWRQNDVLNKAIEVR